VLDATGKLVIESILETKAATILEFFAGLRGTLSVTFEEGTCAGLAKRVNCNPAVKSLVWLASVIATIKSQAGERVPPRAWPTLKPLLGGAIFHFAKT